MSLDLLDRLPIYNPSAPIAAVSAPRLEVAPSLLSAASVQALVAEQAQRVPNALAVADAHRRLSYAELNAQANQVAHYLRGCGVGVEALVAVCMERSVDLVVACLGVLKAGAAYVPLDPAYPSERLAFMLADSGALIALTQQKLLPSLGAHAPRALCLDSEWARFAQESSADPPDETAPENLAYVIYTSGSTGQPKGVEIEHRGLTNLVAWHQHAFAIAPSDRATQLAGPGFDAAVWELWPYLTAGASIHMPEEVTRLDPVCLRDWLIGEEITISFLPTPLAERVIDIAWPREAPLRLLLTGGDQLTRYPRAGLPFTLINNYGPTENSVVSTSGPVRPDQGNGSPPDIGRPIANVYTYILDADLRPVPAGAAGELFIGGIGLARGYRNRPELTAERFLADPFAAEANARMYRSGDLARYRADGAIEFLGRMDQQVKIRGFRIELGEIEAVLKQHPAVREALVVARAASERVAPEKTLVAYLVPAFALECGQDTFVAEVRAFLQTKLPDYMLPAAFVLLARLPLTPNGKVDRQALPAPVFGGQSPQASEPPRSATEAVLLEIWSQVLGRPGVGIHDDFFALGGHSLLAAQAVALVNTALRRSLSLRLLFEAPTVAAFAQALAAETAPPHACGQGDLAAEVDLDAEITALAVTSRPHDGDPGAVFLTGATGFLGAFLLQELLAQTSATIYCLVRAAGAEEGAARIESALEGYGIEHEGWRQRVVPVAGDLRSARLGLSPHAFQRLAGTVDVIYHAGAQVHYLHPYGALKLANVNGTAEILRLASQVRLKPVHYISTIAVAMAGGGHAREDGDLETCYSAKGYDQSKWVAEGLAQLARARGIPVTIYRPGRIGVHSRTGVGNSEDFFTRLLAACFQLGLAPDIPLVENLVPVDYAAQAIRYLSQQPRLTGKTFNLLHPQPIAWQRVIEVAQQLGFSMRLVPYAVWRSAIAQASASDAQRELHSLLALLPEEQGDADWIDYVARYTFDTQNTVQGLAGSAIRCPAVDEAQLARLIALGAREGGLARPGADESPSVRGEPALRECR